MNHPTLHSRNALLQQAVNYKTLPDDVLIRPKQLVASGLVPFSIASVWQKSKIGTFPAPIKVTSGVTAWRLGDIRKWLKNPASYKAEVSV